MTRHERLPNPLTPAPTPEDARRIVAKSLRKGREYTLADIAAITGISERQARCAASRMVEMGLLQRGKVGQAVVYGVAT